MKERGITDGLTMNQLAERNAEHVATIAALESRCAALLDKNIQLQREKDAIEAVALALRDDMRQAREQLEEAEKRIVELPRSASVNSQWKPDVCPVTGRKFFMWIEHETLGYVPTYGGPFDSYTIPTRDSSGEFSCERYDHDFGGWVGGEFIGLHLIDDEEQCRVCELEERIAELERSETQLINERDSAESALNDAYKAVMGQAPEWSNWFSFESAIDEIELACELWRNQTDDVIQFRQHIANLESQKADLMRHVLNAYEASALTMTLRKTVGYLPDYLRFCGIYGVDHEAIIDKLDYQSFVLARVNNEDLRQDAWFDAAESEGE